MTVSIDDNYPDSRIAIGEQISLNFALIQNPGSTEPPSPYDIEIKTFFYQVVAEQRTVGSIVPSRTPAAITAFDFKALDLR